MTLIIGLNLSSRIYLGADTRLTFGQGTYKDDIIKVIKLCGNPLHGQKHNDDNVISMAVAGNLNLAKYLHNIIYNGLLKKELSSDIRQFAKEIENYIKPYLGEWFMKENISSCCIIFGGMSEKNNKKIKLNILKRLQKIYISNIADKKELEDIKDKLYQDPIFKELLKKIPEKNLLSFINDPEKVEINNLLNEAITNNTDTINAPDSLIFSLSIDRNGIYKEIAEWGEFLAFGTNKITKSNFPEEILAQMELYPGQSNTQEDLFELGLIRDSIMHIATKESIIQIGGVVTPIVMKNNKYGYAFQHQRKTLDDVNIEQIFLKDNIFYYQKDQSYPIKLNVFCNYKNNGEAFL